MDRAQANTKEMFNTVSDYTAENNVVWSSTPAIVQMIAELNENIGLIDGKATKQETPITGEATQKHNVRDDFEAKIFVVAGQLCALGAANHDMTLVEESDLTMTQLHRMTDDALEDTGTRIAAALVANQSALEDYGLVGDDLTELNDLKTAFHGMKTAPRTAVAGRKGATATMPDLLRATMALLRLRLDKAMVRFKKSNPTFYAGYLAARVIVDKGNPPAAPAKAPAPPGP